jgi:hypothetical protein
MAGQADVLVLRISRREIVAGRIGDVVDRLMVLSDRREHVKRHEGTMLLEVEGYDSDPREVCEIPEVVGFVRSVNLHWPYWLYFMERSSAQVQMLLCMLTDVERVQVGQGRSAFRFKDMERVQAETVRMCQAATELIETHGIGVEAMDRMSGDVLEILRELFDPGPE